jgi:hypothetical protein
MLLVHDLDAAHGRYDNCLIRLLSTMQTKDVICSVVTLQLELNQVKVEGPDGQRYVINGRTPGVIWSELRIGQMVLCKVTDGLLARVVTARLAPQR